MSYSKIRRSTLVGTYGPGAIIDVRSPSNTPVSGIICGLEDWDDAAQNRGLLHKQVIHERRLERRLFVRGFRLPPVRPDEEANDDVDVLPIARFPRWLVCTRCHRLRYADRWTERGVGRPERYCQRCSDEAADNIFAVPVRFIVACERGHIDDFPWQWWVGCKCAGQDLCLRTDGAGLAGKIVECTKCHVFKSLEGAFGRYALKEYRCQGGRPWLHNGAETCNVIPRVLQRGASNVYWGATESALDIPPFSAELADVFGRYDADLEGRDPAEWPDVIRVLRLVEKTGLTEQQLIDYLHKCKRALDADDVSSPLETGEYEQLDTACRQKVDEGEFRVRPGVVPPELRRWVSGLALADRLREVRALNGFTRIHPPSGPFRSSTQRLAPLSSVRLSWLPAIELLGEGIFVRLNVEEVRNWETQESVQSRVFRLRERIRTDLRDDEVMPDVTPRRLLIHSLAHALIRQLSLECGYSSAALRERLYVDSDQPYMCGLLIHTGSPDSEGTLGGLVAQGTADRFYETLTGAISEAAWCSQDPVCITGTATLSSPRNAAACHACLLLPETSCQVFNLLLDRGMLVGTPEEPDIGFFRALAQRLAE